MEAAVGIKYINITSLSNSNFKFLLQCLKRPHGVCYVSAKSFYFGVGGGVAAFLDLVASDEYMTGERALRLDDGMSNRREILILKWKEVEEGM